MLTYAGIVAKQVCRGPGKRVTCTDFVAKSRTTPYFRHNFSQPATA